MEIVYQMVVKGGYACFDSSATIRSKVVYRKKEDITEEVKEEFIKICTTPMNDKDMWYLSSCDKFDISELELR